MKKSELKSKMCVELRDGDRYLVVDDVLIKMNGFFMIFRFEEDLIHHGDEEFDIIRVYKYVNENYDFNNKLGVCGSILEFDFENNVHFKLLWERGDW